MLSLRALVAAAVLGLGASNLTARPDVAVLRVPDGGLQPQIAVDAEGVAHLVYLKGDPAHANVFHSRLTGAGRFAPAVQVNSDPGSALATGSVRGAHVAIGRNGRVHVAWMGSSQTHAPNDPAPVLYSRSDASARRFEPQRNLTRSDVIGPDGGSLAADAAGYVYVAWHALPKEGRGEADRRLWMARSDDDGKTFAAERVVSDPSAGACACCGSAAFVDRGGTVYALYRAAREGIHRDTLLLRSADRGASFSSIDLHKWDVNACPMSTYALAQDPAGARLGAAWETDGHVYWTRVDVRTGQPAAIVAAGGPDKNQKHPALAVNRRGETLVVWTEGTGWNRGGSLAWQVFDRDGQRVGERGGALEVPVWGLAAAYARPNGDFVIVY